MKALPTWPFVLFLMLAAFPLFPSLDGWFNHYCGRSLGDQMAGLFIFAIVALALNVVVGNVGLLHLGIAGFFGIGAYAVGILTVPAYPFEMSFWLALIAAMFAAAFIGGLIGVPTLRLRGDYLALVTLGFGEVVRYAIRNLDAITAGTRSLNPVPAPAVPGVPTEAWTFSYLPFYYLSLAFLAFTYIVLGQLERSRLGRAWIAVREDELAAQCMGLNTTRLKLAAFIFSAGLAGLAGGLYATKMNSTVGPDAFDFNRSIFLLCCLILGGLGSRNGVLLGVVLLYGFDNILSPIIDEKMQLWRNGPPVKTELNLLAFKLPVSIQMQTFAGWRLFVFGIVLILVMRYRPEGLLPSNRVKDELRTAPKGGAA